MSDARLQTLRRAALTGDHGARVAWLSEMLRTDPACESCDGRGNVRVPDNTASVNPLGVACWSLGRCSVCHGTGSQRRHRVELAAYVGDEAARTALSWGCCAKHRAMNSSAHARLAERQIARGGMCDEDPLAPWARGLSRWGREACVRAAVAAARVAFPAYVKPRMLLASTLQRIGDSLRASEEWLVCPCEEHSRAWRDLDTGLLDIDPPPMGLLAQVQGFNDLNWMPCHALMDADSYASLAVTHVVRSAQEASESSVRVAIREALTSWALGDLA